MYFWGFRIGRLFPILLKHQPFPWKQAFTPSFRKVKLMGWLNESRIMRLLVRVLETYSRNKRTSKIKFARKCILFHLICLFKFGHPKISSPHHNHHHYNHHDTGPHGLRNPEIRGTGQVRKRRADRPGARNRNNSLTLMMVEGLKRGVLLLNDFVLILKWFCHNIFNSFSRTRTLEKS